MKIIIDSGATKSTWYCQENQNIIQLKTTGINPVHQSQEYITEQLLTDLAPHNLIGKTIDSIYYYGAGCIYPITEKINLTLSRIFQCSDIHVQNDLVGAAKALYGKRSGVVAILGTGANSGIYDGTKIVDQIAPMGYILGDEGSGAYIGKTLINDYFRREIPASIEKLLTQKYLFNQNDILNSVYRHPNPNGYLAKMTHLISENIHEEYFQKLITRCFHDFTQKILLKYKDIENYRISFVGSVASIFARELNDVLQEYNLMLGEIVQDPIKRLAAYHGIHIADTK